MQLTVLVANLLTLDVKHNYLQISPRHHYYTHILPLLSKEKIPKKDKTPNPNLLLGQVASQI